MAFLFFQILAPQGHPKSMIAIHPLAIVYDAREKRFWNWGSAEAGFPDTASALRQAIVKNPYLKVKVLEGYYDLATPYYAANYFREIR